MTAMPYRHLQVRPLTNALGAEISGVDLSQVLEPDVFAEIEAAFHRHLVIFFRDQELSPAQQVSFAARFGPVGRYPFAAPIEGHPEVIAVVKEAWQRTNFGGAWHSDTAYLERPPLGSALYALEVPELGGDTLFANMYLAYETLSEGMKTLLDGLKAINTAGKDGGAVRGDHLVDNAGRVADNAGRVADNEDRVADNAMRGQNLDKMNLEAEHPVVRTHPATGRKALYVNGAHSLRFAGMTEAESKPILDFLFGHAVREEFTCRFHWTKGALALWDNRCTQHYPMNDYHGHRRVMHRVTVEGERPR